MPIDPKLLKLNINERRIINKAHIILNLKPSHNFTLLKNTFPIDELIEIKQAEIAPNIKVTELFEKLSP